MRYATLILDVDESEFHPIEAALARDPDLSRKAIHTMELLDDGTLVLLAEVAGDLERYRELLADSPLVHQYALAGDDSGYCYSVVESTPTTTRLLERQRDQEWVVQMPIEYTEDGGMRFTIVGDLEGLSEGMAVPDSWDVQLVSTGRYRPNDEGVFDALTDRQQEVLEAALSMGYYENPREATMADIGEALGVEPGTVGKHLRAIEAKVFQQFRS